MTAKPRRMAMVSIGGVPLAIVNNDQLVTTSKSAAGVENFDHSALVNVSSNAAQQYITDSAGNPVGLFTSGADGSSNAANQFVVASMGYAFNAAGGDWDRMRNDANKSLLVSLVGKDGIQINDVARGHDNIAKSTNDALLVNSTIHGINPAGTISGMRVDTDLNLKTVGPVHRQTDTVNDVAVGTTIDMTKAPGSKYALFLNTLVANSARLEISDDGVLWFGLTTIAGLGAGTLNYNSEVDKPASFIRANCTVNPGATACTMTVVVSK